jgi:polar amino acid transport system permease protein
MRLPDFVYTSRFRNAVSYLLLAAIVVGLYAGLDHATRRVDYIWRWNRMPRYFFAKDKVEVKADFDGTAAVSTGGKETFITITSGLSGRDAPQPQKITLPAGAAVEVVNGTSVRSGDVLGSSSAWKRGILIEGLITTLKFSFISVIFGSIIGLFAGIARIAKNPAARWISITYIELIRGTPLLVQIYIFYFFIGKLFNMSSNAAAILALSVFCGAYVAEIVRAGIQSISRGQMEAARSLGMTYPLAMQHVILPQAFRRILPPLAGQFISLIKDSSLVSIIAILDLAKAGREIASSTFAPFEVYFIVALLYLVITFSLSMMVQLLERRYVFRD